MEKMDILIHPNPVLNQVCAKVDNIDNEIKEIAENIVYTILNEDNAGGLAAPQVGVLKRVFAFDMSEDKDSMRICINPEIIESATTKSVLEEGCLSIPYIGVPVERPDWVKVAYYNENGELVEETLDGINGRCYQHELDHLNGILTLDRVAPLKRSMLLKKYKMMLKKYRNKEQD